MRGTLKSAKLNAVFFSLVTSTELGSRCLSKMELMNKLNVAIINNYYFLSSLYNVMAFFMYRMETICNNFKYKYLTIVSSR